MYRVKIPLILMMGIISLNLRSQKPEIAGLDSAILKADKLIETNPRAFFKNVESFLIYSGDRIIFEKYYNGINKDSLHLIQSQTKSIVSLLLGIAIDKGFVPSENEPVSKFFPEYFRPEDSLKFNLTIKDVLTMSAGFDWEEMVPFNDPGNDNINMFNSNNYLDYILKKPVLKSSYSKFKYNSGCPMIIAGIIEKSTGMSLDKFAELNLFKPLKITDYRWVKDASGFCHAGGGLYLKPCDMLKTGILVLNYGKWENLQIVSENWIRKSVQPRVPTSFDTGKYGYFWWIREQETGENTSATVITAEGAGGQKLYIIPEHKLVVAFTEHNYNTPQVSPLFIKESLLPLLN